VNIDVVVLAAGQGTRMKSALPKVLHPVAGKAMVQHVIDSAQCIAHDSADKDIAVHLVVGHGAEKVKAKVSADSLHWVEQLEQLGTGHAVLQALPGLADDSTTLILYGDVPLIKTETLQGLLKIAQRGAVALLTVELDDATGYGRIIRTNHGEVTAIVEHKDATDDQRMINEINTGIMALPTALLKRWLPQLRNDNAQQEYYLTDIIGFAAHDGITVDTAHPQDCEEVQGVNNRIQLAELERYYQRQQAEALMTAGVTLVDPARLDVRGKLSTGYDVFIDVNVIFEGKVTLGNNVSIGPNCIIKNATIADGVDIQANSMIDDSQLAEDCQIGPYARLRPGTQLDKGAKIGNFVETKKSHIGEGSKVNHLSYIGDAEIGSGVNVGAGTITCNYDGVNKSKTVINDHAFIGSNTSLVAPVNIGETATIGAGSTISGDVPAKHLSVARGKQRNIEGWKRPTKKQ
jgi:bifunctional UDP-N-acetylglucosamine pyrophosphorylase/glucosamine-1-phosphate N-acetyltransferase